VQEAAAELSALISRAQQLMGKMDVSQTAAFSSMFGSTSLIKGDLFAASSGKRQPPGGTGLMPVDEVRSWRGTVAAGLEGHCRSDLLIFCCVSYCIVILCAENLSKRHWCQI
jgi:hypothetical protein